MQTTEKKRKLTILVIALAIIFIGFLFFNGTFAYNATRSGVNYDSKQESSSVKYNVDLQYYGSGSEYTSILNENSVQPFTSSSLWCPGRSEIAYLKVKNNEAFPVNVTLCLDVKNSGFGNTLSYSFIPGMKVSDAKPNNWNSFKSKSKTGSAPLSNGPHSILNNFPLDPRDGNSETYVAICVHMEEDASSIYQGKSAEFSFKLQVDANYEPGATPAPPSFSESAKTNE